MRIVVSPDVRRLVEDAVHRFEIAAEMAIAQRGRFSCALTGGPLAGPLYARLANAPIEWSRVVLLQAHDRPVPIYDEHGRGVTHRMLLGHLQLPADDDEMRGVLGKAVVDLVQIGVDAHGTVTPLCPRPMLATAREVWMFAAGNESAETVRECVEEPSSPRGAGVIARGVKQVTWWLDAKAASRLSHGAPSRAAPP